MEYVHYIFYSLCGISGFVFKSWYEKAEQKDNELSRHLDDHNLRILAIEIKFDSATKLLEEVRGDIKEIKDKVLHK